VRFNGVSGWVPMRRHQEVVFFVLAVKMKISPRVFLFSTGLTFFSLVTFSSIEAGSFPLCHERFFVSFAEIFLCHARPATRGARLPPELSGSRP